MNDLKPISPTVRQIMREIQATIAKTGGEPGRIELWDEPPPPAPAPPSIALSPGRQGWTGSVAQASRLRTS